ncbi:MAG: hypothetical protein Q7S72_00680 [Candidatus Taylorbacteria bacterium]|nr:hypothetical protein [Candidatus Taylorbacteria bacterium]
MKKKLKDTGTLRKSLNSEEDRKISYVFFHTVKGSTQKIYHVDSMCTTSKNRAYAKVYVKGDLDKVRSQLNIIRKNFEFAFTYPHYASHKCWRGANVEDIETQYEKL